MEQSSQLWGPWRMLSAIPEGFQGGMSRWMWQTKRVKCTAWLRVWRNWL